MKLINKDELVRQFVNSEIFNSPLPKWFWSVLNGISIINESESEDAESSSRVQK